MSGIQDLDRPDGRSFGEKQKKIFSHKRHKIHKRNGEVEKAAEFSVSCLLWPISVFEINARSLTWLEGLDDDRDVPTSY